MRSFWLCRKPKRRRALRVQVERSMSGPDGPPRVGFEVYEPENDGQVRAGTVTRARAACLCCGAVLPPERVRAQLFEQRGGADAIFDGKGERIGGARLTAVVTLKPGEKGRHYRLPVDADYVAVREAQSRLAEVLREWERGGKQGLCPVPDEPTPAGGGSGAGRAFSVQRYGMLQWGDLFTARQKVALMEVGQLICNPDCAQSSACDIESMETRAQASRKHVIPAKAGIQRLHEKACITRLVEMDSRFRGNDEPMIHAKIGQTWEMISWP